MSKDRKRLRAVVQVFLVNVDFRRNLTFIAIIRDQPLRPQLALGSKMPMPTIKEWLGGLIRTWSRRDHIVARNATSKQIHP